MDKINQANWDKCVAFHGHACPGLATGFRVANYAKKVLMINDIIEDEDIVCIAETEACAVDALQVLLKTTTGTGALIIDFKGKNAYSIFNRKNNLSARFIVKYLSDKTISKPERMEKILNASDEELFEIKNTTRTFPEKARLYQSMKCENCGEIVADICTKNVNGKVICSDCAV